jgi:hypothetical protein
VDFDVEEVEPGRWRWKISSKAQGGPKAVGEPKYRTRGIMAQTPQAV